MGSTPGDIQTNGPLLNGQDNDKENTDVNSRQSTMEKQMERDADQVLRDWDQYSHQRRPVTEKDLFRTRPMRNSQSGSRLSGRFSLLAREDSLPNYSGRFVPVERVSEQEAADDPDTLGFDTSAESIEDDSTRKPVYTICPRTGRKLFRAQFDVHGFELNDLRVKICGRKLIVFAMRQENDSGRQSTTEFCKKLKLPDDVNTERLECALNEGLLTVEAPAITRSTSLSLLLERSTDMGEQLNVPHIREGEVGKMLHLLVEIGCVFKANNVIVRLNGKNKLLVVAERKDETVYQRLNANLTREFNLSQPIYPHSLKAGLTHDGILKVTARIQEDVEDVPVINGDHSPPSPSVQRPPAE